MERTRCRTSRGIAIAGWGLVLCMLAVMAPVNSYSAGKKFPQKDCLDCHKKFADKYFSMKDIHPVVKQKNCEACHLRHGIVPKLLLKEEGNSLCYSCHNKAQLGMEKAHIHSALKFGTCYACHNPHASQAKYLLKTDEKEICYQCHKKREF